jgi:hypothetical protein
VNPGTSCAAGVVQRRLQIVNIVWGPRPSDAVGMHVAAWVLGESLMHWAGSWTAPEARRFPLSFSGVLDAFGATNRVAPKAVRDLFCYLSLGGNASEGMSA